MGLIRIVRIGDATLYHANCADVIGGVTADALITDPPYGVSGGSGTLGKASQKTKYSDAFEDTREYVGSFIVPTVIECLSFVKRGIITPGTPCCFLYPPPDDMGVLYQPAATGMNKWGRETTQPVLYYGKDPRAGLTIQAKHYVNTEKADKNGHPCPKPNGVMNWMVHRGSLEGEVVLDPFMGSGTTGVACAALGRKFIGIEVDANYFDIACERIDNAYRQGRLI